MSLADAVAYYFADHPVVSVLAAAACVLVGTWLAIVVWSTAASVLAWALRGIARRWPRLAYLGELVDGPPIPDVPDVRQHQLDHLTLTLVEADSGLTRGRYSRQWWSTVGPLPLATSRNLDALVERGWVEVDRVLHSHGGVTHSHDEDHDQARQPVHTLGLTEEGVRALHALACDDPAAHLELVDAARPDTTTA